MNYEGVENGYFRLYRKFQDHPFWKKKRRFSFAEAWLDLLFKASYSEHDFLFGLQIIHVGIGDVITSMEKLAEAWGWDRGRVRRFLNFLENEHKVNIKPATKYTRLTICNFREYQEWRPPERPTNDQQTTNKRPTNDHIQERKVKIIKETKKSMSEVNPTSDIPPGVLLEEEKTPKILPKYLEDSRPFRMATWFLTLIRPNLTRPASPNLQQWAKDCDGLLRIDGISPALFKEVTEWVVQDDFEKTNILSPAKLRKRFDHLVLEMRRAKKRAAGMEEEEWFPPGTPERIAQDAKRKAAGKAEPEWFPPGSKERINQERGIG